MEYSPSQKTAVAQASREIPRLLWNPKAHYSVHKSPPFEAIMRQLEQVHNLTSYLWKIRFTPIYA
jgi:hypothetical protein